MSDKNGAPISFYHRFSTETLENMLRDMTLSDAELDMEQMDLILSELESREPNPNAMAPEDALRVFQEEYSGNESGYLDCAYEEKETQTSRVDANPNHPKHKHIGIRALIVAATVTALLFGSVIAAQAGGFDVFGAVANWTTEVFGFGDVYKPLEEPDASEFVWPDNNVPEGTEFSSLQEALDAYGIDFEIAEPTWLPSGYTTKEILAHYDSKISNAYFLVCYENEYGSTICVTFQNYNDVPGVTYEKNDAPVEEYTIGNITYYVFSNTRTEKVAWTTAHFECCVYGTVTRETVRAVAESIYH